MPGPKAATLKDYLKQILICESFSLFGISVALHFQLKRFFCSKIKFFKPREKNPNGQAGQRGKEGK